MNNAAKQRVLITGSNGLLGQSLVKQFIGSYYVTGCDLAVENYNSQIPGLNYLALDLTDRDQMHEFISSYKPDIVINAAAFTDVDRSEEERERCWSVNVRSVELMLEFLSNYNPLFVQISTDYVFDGKRGNYKETDQTNPVSYYGETKIAAENFVRSSGINYIIGRSQVLYGTGTKIRNNFVLWVIGQLQKKNKIFVVNDQNGNPTLADDLSEAVFRLLEKREYGLFHIAGNQPCTRLEFARKIAEVFDLDQQLIQETNSRALKQKATRPMNSTFNLDKLYNVLDWLPGDLDTSLQKLKLNQVAENGK